MISILVVNTIITGLLVLSAILSVKLISLTYRLKHYAACTLYTLSLGTLLVFAVLVCIDMWIKGFNVIELGAGL